MIVLRSATRAELNPDSFDEREKAFGTRRFRLLLMGTTGRDLDVLNQTERKCSQKGAGL